MKLATAILTAAASLAWAGDVGAQQRVPPPPPYPQQPLPQQRVQAPSDGRVLWVYETSVGEGEFRQLPNGRWREVNPEAQFFYRELRRTPNYVELYDARRGLYVRLYDGYLLQRNNGGGWIPGYEGTWE
jgi:hypothetical protein